MFCLKIACATLQFLCKKNRLRLLSVIITIIFDFNKNVTDLLFNNHALCGAINKIFICMKKLTIAALCLLSLAACAPKQTVQLIDKQNFAKEVDGKMVELFTIKNDAGVTAQITNLGARIVSLWVPDNKGVMQDVVMGFETLDEYQKSADGVYFGALIGRYGNRIGGAAFTLNDSTYQVDRNEGRNSLHGGKKGYFNVVLDGKQLSDSVVEFSYLSQDGEAGFPGNLQVKVVYTITKCNAIKIEYFAETDKPTICNLTNHSFFNLSGDASTSINDHVLMINADQYTPVDFTLIPTGELASLDSSALDFRTPTAIGDRIEQVRGGYDHNYVLNAKDSCSKCGLILGASVTSPVSGITMDVLTNEPGIQFYAGNFISGKETGKYGKLYGRRCALCLETQHFPDSPNKANFPSTVLNPGEKYYSVCVYKFSAK